MAGCAVASFESARFVPSDQLHAIQQIRKLRGGSQSQLMRASDGHHYCVKFTNTPQGIRILANEMLASRIGGKLALPTPQTEVIEVSEWLVTNTPELRMANHGVEELCSSGPQLGSRYPGNPEDYVVFDYLPESLFPETLNRRDLIRALVLDKWLGNADGRQAVYSRPVCATSGYHLTLIDQGYCFNAEAWDFPDLALHGVYYRNYVYRDVTGWDSFEPTLSCAEQMTLDDLWDCARDLPPAWCGSDPGALHELIQTIHRRRAKIRKLIGAFRDSSRAPFPNWRRSTACS